MTHGPESDRPGIGPFVALLAATVLVAVAAAPRPRADAAETAPLGASDAGRSIGSALYLPYASAAHTARTVLFSERSGARSTGFVLELRDTRPGGELRFTLDGSEPEPDRARLYGAPLPITRTTVIRAAAFADGERASAVETRTYVFPADVLWSTDEAAVAAGLPPTWGAYGDRRWDHAPVPARYGLDPVAAAEHGAAIQEALLRLPIVSVVAPPADLFGPDGIYANPLVEGREVPASMELLPFGTEAGVRADCGLRIAGGWSRRPDVTPKHSFSLHFRGRYGPTRLSYRLFSDSDVDSFDTLRLRGGQADSFPYFANKAQYAHDAWARATQRDMGWLSPRDRFVHLYLNGLYWGLYDVTEEPTAAFAAAHLGDAESAWDVVKDGRTNGRPGPPEVEDGTLEAFHAMQAIVAESPEPDPARADDRARYARLAALLDLAQHIDYTLLQIYGANVDWPLANYRAVRDRELLDRFQFLVWDYEHTTALRDDGGRAFCQSPRDPDTGECGYIADTAGVAGLHGWLARFPEYRLAFADRAQAHLLGDGALTPDAASARYARIAQDIEAAVPAEAARWGTGKPQPQAKLDQAAVWNEYNAKIGRGPQTAAMWRGERDRLLATFFPGRTEVVIGQLCRRGWMPPVNAPAWVWGDTEPAPAGRAAGGAVSLGVSDRGCPGSQARGQIYYTLDGTDPRESWTGAASATARLYTRPIFVSGFTRIRARTLAATGAAPDWSAMTEIVLGTPRLRVSEIQYHPSSDAGPEFVEIENLESSALPGAAVGLEEAVTGTARALAEIPPRGFAVLASDAAAFHAAHPGVGLAGVFAGRLDNAGETLALRYADQVVDRPSYDDGPFWPPAADGLGHSLVRAAEDVGASRPESWRASRSPGGSPGRADPPPLPGHGSVVVSEVLASPATHQEDAIELANTSGSWVDIGGWWLSDDRDDLARYRVPANTWLEPYDTYVVYRSQFHADPERGFGLSADGESVFLTAAGPDGALTGAIASLAFGPSEPGVSWGRHRTSRGLVAVPLARPTFGQDAPDSPEAFRSGRGGPNAPPLVGPVVLNEVLVAPGGSFIEVRNAGTETVYLGDASPAGTAWRVSGAIAFPFPPDAALAPGELALVVGSDPRAWARARAIPSGTRVFGPYAGTLDPEGGEVALLRPSRSDAEGALGAMVAADAVRYGPAAPLGLSPPGAGRSLERIEPLGLGDDPATWCSFHIGGSPGRANTPVHRAFLPLLARTREPAAREKHGRTAGHEPQEDGSAASAPSSDQSSTLPTTDTAALSSTRMARAARATSSGLWRSRPARIPSNGFAAPCSPVAMHAQRLTRDRNARSGSSICRCKSRRATRFAHSTSSGVGPISRTASISSTSAAHAAAGSATSAKPT